MQFPKNRKCPLKNVQDQCRYAFHFQVSLYTKKGVRFCVQKYKFIYSLKCQQLAGLNDVRTLKDLTLLVVRLECESCSGKLSVLDSKIELHHHLDHLKQNCISV